MSNNNVIKCKHCGKVFFDNKNEYCPFCGKKLKDDFKDLFGDIFGNQNNPYNNPFDGFGIT